MITDVLTIQQYGEGVRGAVRTAAFLADNVVDARIGELPRPGVKKVDVDDLREWAGEDGLAPIVASARPVAKHPAYDPKE